jgi:transcriptional regulator with XRE-family HTH domain
MAKRVKALRLAQGLTQAQLAQRAGISRKHVIRIEAAEQEPTLGVIEKLAKALKVRPAELIE